MSLRQSKYHITLSFCLIAAFFILLDGTKGPLVLDDFRNLSPLLGVETPDYSDVILNNESGPFGRRISMSTFVINHWLRNKINVIDLKITNLVLHLVNGLLLYLTLIYLFKEHYKKDQRYRLALAITLCWVLSPINSSVVFYTIQRMTMLATFFVLTGCFIYVYMRPLCCITKKRKCFIFFLLAMCWLLAALSKENGILLPGLVLCIELCFYDELRSWIKKLSVRNLYWITSICLIFFIFSIGLIDLKGYLDYSYRDFNLVSRLATQPIVLIDYMRRLLLPFSTGTGLYADDVAILTSFWNRQTVFCCLLLIFIIIICFYSLFRDKFRYLSFGLLFFLLAHSIESTVFPLEMYFSHRNYLPSIGFYFFLVSLIHVFFSYIGSSRLYLVVLAMYLSLFAVFSYEVSKVWSSEERIIVYAYYHHPQSVRANMSMVEMLKRNGKLAQALEINAMIIEQREDDAFRPLIQRIYLHCWADMTLPPHEYKRFSLAIDRFHALEVSNALKNLFDIHRSRKCAGVDLVVIVNHLSKWVDKQLDLQIYSAEQIWHLEYYVIEFLLLVEDRDRAIQRLNRFMQLNNISATEYFKARVENRH